MLGSQVREGLDLAQDEGPRPIRVALVDDHQLVLDGLAVRLHDPENGLSIVAIETSWSGSSPTPNFRWMSSCSISTSKTAFPLAPNSVP